MTVKEIWDHVRWYRENFEELENCYKDNPNLYYKVIDFTYLAEKLSWTFGFRQVSPTSSVVTQFTYEEFLKKMEELLEGQIDFMKKALEIFQQNGEESWQGLLGRNKKETDDKSPSD